ncbi:hypothetical protein V6Z11_A10G130300 [Gossypium hirsutum]
MLLKEFSELQLPMNSMLILLVIDSSQIVIVSGLWL